MNQISHLYDHAAGFRLMADSTRPQRIPSYFNAAEHLVAPYIDGTYRWPAAQLRRFSRAVQVPVTVLGDPAAMIGDVESGDLDPPGFARWLAARIDAGEHWHACYASRDTKPLVDQAVEDMGLDPRIFGWWCADPTGIPHLFPGSEATQYFWGRQFDLSAVRPAWHRSVAAALAGRPL